MTEIRIVDRRHQPTAGVRERIPMDRLTEFFPRAFHETMELLAAQGIAPAGAPFGKYFGMPSTTVDVEAGVPVATPIEPAGDVIAGELPGGRVVETVHVGPHETLEDTYLEVQRFFAEHGLTPGAIMWESYLSDPETEPDPAAWRTLISWTVA
jgi:effector-binding domain-containing protein